MVFSNLIFLFIFLPIVLTVYYLGPKKFRNMWLLLASLFFYAWGEPLYVTVMLGSIVMNYLFGLLLTKFDGNDAKQKQIVALSVIGNIGLLGVFKYASFFVNNVNSVFNLSFEIPGLSLPIGISFFTFQAMSYVIDVYRKDAKVQKNLFDLALYITLFPQLVAGPIVRYQTVADEIVEREHTVDKFAEGVQRFLAGLTKKVLIANPMGQVADEIFILSAGDLSTATAWVGILAYTIQIYFDFSGYSDMAIGLGKMFGFTFLENFNYPYISKSVGEFWRRWHISLSTWFRDYVYIPLGGNRVSPWKFYRNLFVVWTLTGFWHGASWTFMAWGFYYGLLMAIERAWLGKVLQKAPKLLQHVYVLVLVMIGWVFFRADSFSYSFAFIQSMFGGAGEGFLDHTAVYYLMNNWEIFILGMLFSMPILPWLKQKLAVSIPNFSETIVFSITQATVYMLLFLYVIMQLVNSSYNPFIYFRF
ncbi:MAG: MBOAT family O-acyltransferase [Bacilli bacterium]